MAVYRRYMVYLEGTPHNSTTWHANMAEVLADSEEMAGEIALFSSCCGVLTPKDHGVKVSRVVMLEEANNGMFLRWRSGGVKTS